MSDRWVNIYHFYHQFVTYQIQAKCPKYVPPFGHSLPTAMAMSAQVMEPSPSMSLMHL